MDAIAAMWTWLGVNVASVIAVCTAGFTLYQARLQRHHNISTLAGYGHF